MDRKASLASTVSLDSLDCAAGKLHDDILQSTTHLMMSIARRDGMPGDKGNKGEPAYGPQGQRGLKVSGCTSCVESDEYVCVYFWCTLRCYDRCN